MSAPAPLDLTGRRPLWPDGARRRWAQASRRAEEDSRMHVTPPREGWPDLRETLAIELGQLPEDHLPVVTAGVRAMAAALGVAREVWLEQPTFVGVRKVFEDVATRLHRFAWADLGELQAGPGAVVWVTSPARNPDGATLSRAHEQDLARLAHGGAIVVVNETYRITRFGAAPQDPLLCRVGTLAKLVGGGGTRTGWLTGNIPGFVRGFLRGTSPPSVHQVALAEFFRAGGGDLLRGSMQPAMSAAELLRGQLGSRIRGTPSGWSLLVDVGAGADALVDAPGALGLRCGGGRDFDALPTQVRFCTSGFTSADLATLQESAQHIGRELECYARR